MPSIWGPRGLAIAGVDIVLAVASAVSLAVAAQTGWFVGLVTATIAGLSAFGVHVRSVLAAKPPKSAAETARRLTAAVLDRDRKVVGHAFPVADRYLLTTCHVVNRSIGRSPNSTDRPARASEDHGADIPYVNCVWEGDTTDPIGASIQEWSPGGKYALLLLHGHLPPGVRVKNVGPAVGADDVVVEAWQHGGPTFSFRGRVTLGQDQTGSVEVQPGGAAPTSLPNGADVEGAVVVRHGSGVPVGMITGTGANGLPFRAVQGLTNLIPNNPPALHGRQDEHRWWARRAFRGSLAGLGAACLVIVAVGFGVHLIVHPAPATCVGNKVSLEVVSSTEKDGLIAHLARRYQAEKDPCARISVHGVSSGTAETRLAKGWNASKPEDVLNSGQETPEPDLWLPTDRIWADMLASDAGDAGRLADGWDEDLEPVASSVMVIAMPEDRRELLGTAPSWRDLVVAADSRKLAMAIDNPVDSTSGLATSVALNDALVKDDEDGVGMLRNAIATVPNDLADDDITALMGKLYDSMDTPGGAYSRMGAVVAEEQSVYLFNCGNPLGDDVKKCSPIQNQQKRLVTTVPTDGTYALNHPAVRMSSLETDEDKAGVADGFVNWLRSDAAQKEFAESGFRAADDPKTATSELESVGARDLPAPNPWPSVKKVREYQSRWQSVRLPARVRLVVDNSGSMTDAGSHVPVARFIDGCTQKMVAEPTYLQIAQAAALDALGQLQDRTDAISFNAFPEPSTQGWAPLPMTVLTPQVRDKITKQICALDGSGGSTPLYGAIDQARKPMKGDTPVDRASRPAIVVLSDGGEDASSTKGEPDRATLLESLANEPKEPVTAVAIGDADVDDLRTT